MQSIYQYLDPRLFVIAVILYIMGMFLKRIPHFNEDWAIPLILWVLGVVLTGAYYVTNLSFVFSGEVIMLAIIQGTFNAALAVFGNETFKQTFVKRLED